jgi:hypothetical protein
MSYVEVSAWSIVGALVLVFSIYLALGIKLLALLRSRHPVFYREVGEPGIVPPWPPRPLHQHPEGTWWHPGFDTERRLAALNDREVVSLFHRIKRLQLAVLGIVCFAILVQLPLAWLTAG